MSYAIKLSQPFTKFKIMKTQNNNLDFSKSSILELNDQEMFGINTAGGSISIYWGQDKETEAMLVYSIYWGV